MGLAIGKAMDAIDGTDAAKEEERQKMKSLKETGDNLVKKFFEGIRQEDDPKKFKIGKIITEFPMVTLMTKADSSNVQKTVGNIVHEMVKGGDVADMITAVVVGGLEGLLGEKIGGSIVEKTLYTVKLEGIGLQRIDIFMYQNEFSADGMIGTYESLFVYAYTISTIGQQITKQDLDTFISLWVPDVDKDGKKLDPEELIAKQTKIFKMLEPCIQTT